MSGTKTPKLSYSSVFLLLSLGLVFIGCSATRSVLEPTPPPELVKPAIVSTPSPFFRGGRDLITIKTIDGKAPTFLDTKVVVSPGKHTFHVELELHHDSSTTTKSYVTRVDSSLVFAVDAGHEYLIDAVEDTHGLWLWVKDLADKTIVAGEPPRELPPEDRTRPMWEK
jgi:hypothetical protein